MFLVPESDAKKPENRFEFQVGEKKYSVPKLGFVNGEASLLLEQDKNLEGLIAAFDDDEAREAYKSLQTDQRAKFNKEWVSASKVSPGESDSSADS